MKLIIKKGTTSRFIHIFIQDSSKSDGSGLTGLVYNSTGLTAYYIREGDMVSTVITLVAAIAGNWISGGFIQTDATNMPGVYELHLPNACFAVGAEQVVVLLKGATNMAPVPLEIQLQDNTEKDIYDRIGAPVAASISADISGRAPANEYDTKMSYIPSDLASVPTATELNTDHGSGVWTPADVSALATTAALSTHDGKLDNVKAKTDYIPSDLASVPTATELNTDHGSGSWVGTTAAAIASAVWDALKTDHNIAGSFGNHVSKKLLSVAKFLGLK